MLMKNNSFAEEIKKNQLGKVAVVKLKEIFSSKRKISLVTSIKIIDIMVISIVQYVSESEENRCP